MRYHLIDTRTGEIIRELSQRPRSYVRPRFNQLDVKLAIAAGIALGLLVPLH